MVIIARKLVWQKDNAGDKPLEIVKPMVNDSENKMMRSIPKGRKVAQPISYFFFTYFAIPIMERK